jgi:hypothetical protein
MSTEICLRSSKNNHINVGFTCRKGLSGGGGWVSQA